jgi:hypothetical protein
VAVVLGAVRSLGTMTFQSSCSSNGCHCFNKFYRCLFSARLVVQLPEVRETAKRSITSIAGQESRTWYDFINPFDRFDQCTSFIVIHDRWPFELAYFCIWIDTHYKHVAQSSRLHRCVRYGPQQHVQMFAGQIL